MFKIIGSTLDADMTRELKRLDLTVSQFVVLMTLSENEGLTQTELGKKVNMPGYATTRTIDALEESGFVERRKDERSRRSHRIFLTSDSRKLQPALFSTVAKVNTELLSPLNAKEQKNLSDILHKLVASRPA